jgi:hypothetical protein
VKISDEKLVTMLCSNLKPYKDFFKGNLLKETKNKPEKDTKLEVIGGKSRATKKNEKIEEERILREEEIKNKMKGLFIFCSKCIQIFSTEEKRNEHEKNYVKSISQKDKIRTLFIEEIYKSSRKLNKNQTLILDSQEKFEDVF